MSNLDPRPEGRAALTIGEVARRAGRRASSIRYYEQIGLLPAPARVAGRRVYDPSVLRTLAVIETGQRAGLSLEEISALLAASPDDAAAIDRLREVAERKLPEITALIERSRLVREWLECAALRVPEPGPVPAVRGSGSAAGRDDAGTSSPRPGRSQS